VQVAASDEATKQKSASSPLGRLSVDGTATGLGEGGVYIGPSVQPRQTFSKEQRTWLSEIRSSVPTALAPSVERI
jgi:hypothetical protein